MDELQREQIAFTRFASSLPSSYLKLPVKSASEVQKEATQRSHTIHAAYHTLGEIIERHEKTIQTRWDKKGRQKRLDVLLDAWPDMAPVIRIDWTYLVNETASELQETKNREGYLWPSMNQKGLLKSKNLLVMLHARARHHPTNFAAGDIKAIQFALRSAAILPVSLDGYVMVLNGATDPNTYGKLVPLDDSDRQHRMRMGVFVKQFSPGEGLLILEIQERMLTFLVACCQSILYDIAPDDLTSDKFPIQPAPHLETDMEAEKDGFASLAIMAAEAPYRLPAHIDFVRIERVLAAKVAAARDHMWAMREDPAYFTNCIDDTREHRPEMLTDTQGGFHPMLWREGKDIFRSVVIGDLFLKACWQVEVFGELHLQARELRLLHNKYASQISVVDDLPVDLFDRLINFRFFLQNTKAKLLVWLRETAPASPPLRRLFTRIPVGADDDCSKPTALIKSEMISRQTKIETQVCLTLELLSTNNVRLHYLGTEVVLDDLEHLLESEPEAADLVSSRVAKIISDLSIVTQCETQLGRFQPWARGFAPEFVQNPVEVYAQYLARNEYLYRAFSPFTLEFFFSRSEFSDDYQRRFYYPADKRPTKDNIETLRKAEHNLDVFWGVIDNVITQNWDRFRHSHTGKVLVCEKRTLFRTPEWVEVVPVRKKGQCQKTNPKSGSDRLCEPFAAVHLDSFEPAAKNLKAQLDTTKKVKIKTKGLPSESTPRPKAATPEKTPSEPPEPPVIVVDARALKVFRTLFFNPGVTSSPGEIPWKDFVYAMTSTGQFTAKKLFGSAWQFQRRDGEGQSSIQFHQPHPLGKIHFTLARRMGRRLNRTFGWTLSTFVLKANEKTT